MWKDTERGRMIRKERWNTFHRQVRKTRFSLKDFLNPPEKEHRNAADLKAFFLHL